MASEVLDQTLAPWVSAHLHTSNAIRSIEFDRFILGPVKDFLGAQAESRSLRAFFFVRYTEGGDHLRLRMSLGEADAPTIVGALGAYVDRWNRRAIGQETIDLRWVDYVPEVARYGGADAMKVAECFFCSSSLQIIELLSRLELGDRKARLGLALTAMLALLTEAAPGLEPVAKYLAQYCGAYARSLGDAGFVERVRSQLNDQYATQADALNANVARVWDRLHTCDTDDLEISEFKLGANSYIRQLLALTERGDITVHGRDNPEWKDCVSRIVMSAMHMTNNRIGIAPSEEMYLAHVGSKALRARTTGSSNNA